MAQHAMLSPSSAVRWMTCLGSLAMQHGIPDEGNDYADEGTAGHFLASECLKDKCDPIHFLTRTILVGYHIPSDWDGAVWGPDVPEGFSVRNTYVLRDCSEMILAVRKYVQSVRHMAEGAIFTAFEQAVPISQITGEEGATGTADYYLVTESGTELQVHDLKLGHNVVSPEHNPQLMLYALGVLEDLELSGLAEGIEQVRLLIHQPRVFNDPSEWTCSIDELRQFEALAAERAAAARAAFEFRENWMGRDNSYLVPSEAACKYCLASPTCPGLQAYVVKTVSADFEDLSDVAEAKALPVPSTPGGLGAARDAVPLVEVWLSAVCKAVDKALREGLDVPSPLGGYKLVRGKSGARAWIDATKAKEVMRSLRLKSDVMYNRSLISPTQAEKLTSGDAPEISKRQWERLTPLVVKPEGGLSVALMTDKRPAVVVAARTEDFEDLPSDNGEDLG